MRKARTARFIGGVLLLALAMTVGVGYTYVNYLEEDGLVTRLVTETWIPFFVLGAAVVAALMLLGAAPVHGRRVSPWTLLPAAVLAVGLCIATRTPVVWLRYKFSYWMVPFAAVFAYALLLWRFLCALADGACRKTPFDSRAALKAALIVVLLYLPGALAGIISLEPVRFALPVLPGWFWMPIYLLSGAAALAVVERGHKAAGIALLTLGAAELALCLCALFSGETLGEGARLPFSLMIQMAGAVWTLSVPGFCLFGGIKCLLPEKKS